MAGHGDHQRCGCTNPCRRSSRLEQDLFIAIPGRSAAIDPSVLHRIRSYRELSSSIRRLWILTDAGLLSSVTEGADRQVDIPFLRPLSIYGFRMVHPRFLPACATVHRGSCVNGLMVSGRATIQIVAANTLEIRPNQRLSNPNATRPWAPAHR